LIPDPYLIRTLPCPNAAEVCAQSVWLFQNLLLGSEADMAQVVEAITKIQRAWHE